MSIAPVPTRPARPAPLSTVGLVSPGRVRWGRTATAAGLVGWAIWIGWRLASLAAQAGAGSVPRVVDVYAHAVVVSLELVAFGTALVITRSMWSGSTASGIERARAVIATDGARRAMTVVVAVVVLLLGASPASMPSVGVGASLLAGLVCVAVGHWWLSAGTIRPGDRLLWSMESIGGGRGPGEVRSGIPDRWALVMGSIVALNVAIALRGFSDRWTHGLPSMADDARLLVMAHAGLTVVAGLLALRRLPAPQLDYFGASGRLEEWSARRWALGATATLAVVGFAVSVPPMR
jgi:fumarate reductase subunit C